MMIPILAAIVALAPIFLKLIDFVAGYFKMKAEDKRIFLKNIEDLSNSYRGKVKGLFKSEEQLGSNDAKWDELENGDKTNSKDSGPHN